MPRLTADARRTLNLERKSQILAAATRVFANKGFERATISDIARQARVSEGLIYNYFKNKADLLVQIPFQLVQPAFHELQRAAGAPTADQPSPPTLLGFIARNMVSVVTQNPDIIRVLIATLPSMSAPLRAKYFDQVPLPLLEEYIRKQQAAGVFRHDLDPALTARLFPGMMLFFLMIQEVLRPPNLVTFAYDEVIHAAVHIFLNGVLVESTPLPGKA